MNHDDDTKTEDQKREAFQLHRFALVPGRIYRNADYGEDVQFMFVGMRETKESPVKPYLVDAPLFWNMKTQAVEAFPIAYLPGARRDPAQVMEAQGFRLVPSAFGDDTPGYFA